mgnify:CR=1 FL=1
MSANILTVDDSASIRLTTRIALTNAGYSVTEAVDGADGLTKLKSGNFDLIVTDLNMPNMDGLTMIPIWERRSSSSQRNQTAISSSRRRPQARRDG